MPHLFLLGLLLCGLAGDGPAADTPIAVGLRPIAVLFEASALEARAEMSTPMVAVYPDGTLIARTHADREYSAYAHGVLGQADLARLTALCGRATVDAVADRFDVGRPWFAIDEVESRIELGVRSIRVRGDLRFDPSARALAPAGYVALFDELLRLADRAREPWVPSSIDVILVPHAGAAALAPRNDAQDEHAVPDRPIQMWPSSWAAPQPGTSVDRLSAQVDGSQLVAVAHCAPAGRVLPRVQYAGRDWALLFRVRLPHEAREKRVAREERQGVFGPRGPS